MKIGFYKVLTVVVIFPLAVCAQSWKSKPFSLGILNNSTLLPPESFIAPFNQPLHPGLIIGYEFGWRETIKNPMFQNTNTFNLGGREVYTGKFFQDVSLAYYYHQYLNHAFAFTTHGGYRKYIRKFTAEISVHLGYLHTQMLTERFMRKDGMWITGHNPARGFFVTGIGAGVGYDAGYSYNMKRFFLNYDFRLQMPFIKDEVPILPNGVIWLGLQLTLFKKSIDKGTPLPSRLSCPES